MSRDDDSVDPLLLRRRRRQERANRRMILGAVGVAAVLLVGGVIALGLMISRNKQGKDGAGAGVAVAPSLPGLSGLIGPSASREGETWTHDDLVAHINSRGVKVFKHPTESGTAYGPACYLTRDGVERPIRGPGTVYVQKRASSQEAKDTAAATSSPSFAWGRYWFFATDDPKLLADVKKTLP